MRKRSRQDTSTELVLVKEDVREGIVSRHEHDEEANASRQAFSAIDIDRHHRAYSNTSKRRIFLFLFVGILATCSILLLVNYMTLPSTVTKVQYSCPVRVNKAPNDIPTENFEYERVTNQIKSNLTGYMQSFRNSTFDAWGRSYERVKEGMYHWKSTRFAPHLNNGDSIYESACGIGMNLYMTMELLNEVKRIESLVVYGNEYVSASAEVANAVWDQNPPFQARKGTICTGDSANIDFVPSDSFDLVYTGYITPINDPLHLYKGDMNQNIAFYKTLCEGDDRQSMKLSKMAQRAQEDFYGEWVGQMVRIAKPGKPVIVEQVSMPLCDEPLFDWGGVSKEFWGPAISRYGWDVDPSSIEMEKDSIFHNRYHVFMRKNPS